MNKPPPHEPHPPLSLTIRDLVFKVPTVVALLAVGGLFGVPLSLAYRAGQEAPVEPRPTEQFWTAGTGAVASMGLNVALGALPAPDIRQRRPPCNDAMGEQEFDGVCWIWLGKPPPCPAGQAWERGGRCYARVLEVKPLPREPTSGEGRPLGVAEP